MVQDAKSRPDEATAEMEMRHSVAPRMNAVAGGWEARWEYRSLGACELTTVQLTRALSASLDVVGLVP
jgi:uncharacterized protein YjaG (DUF416 family)